MFDKDRIDACICFYASVCFYILVIVVLIFGSKLFEFFLAGVFLFSGSIFFFYFGIHYARSNLFRRFGVRDDRGDCFKYDLKIRL